MPIERVASLRKQLRIKGILLQVFQDHLRALVEQGGVELDGATPWPVLQEEVAIAGWYPLPRLIEWCDQVASLVGRPV